MCPEEVADFIKFANDSYNSIHNHEKNFLHLFPVYRGQDLGYINYSFMCTERGIVFDKNKLIISKPIALLKIFKAIYKDIESGIFEVEPVWIYLLLSPELIPELTAMLEKFKLNL